jgi:isoleucyl-tRNA synthetase
MLADGTDDLPSSVHLSDWPVAGEVDSTLIFEMGNLRGVITSGLAMRAEANIKVRQPLQSVTLTNCQFSDEYDDIVKEELNVKEVIRLKKKPVDPKKTVVKNIQEGTLPDFGIKLDTHLTPELKREGLMREMVRNIQNTRKQADLQVDDRIHLSLVTEDKELAKAIDEHRATIMQETLAITLNEQKPEQYSAPVKVGGAKLTISLVKA